jgi:hypothetical protein
MRRRDSARKLMERLVVDQSSSEQSLNLAAELLARCSGVVVLDGVATLSPGPREIECSVAKPAHSVARCEEEYKVLVENAARTLQASKLGPRLPNRPLRWVVVDEHDAETVELWRAPT